MTVPSDSSIIVPMPPPDAVGAKFVSFAQLPVNSRRTSSSSQKAVRRSDARTDRELGRRLRRDMSAPWPEMWQMRARCDGNEHNSVAPGAPGPNQIARFGRAPSLLAIPHGLAHARGQDWTTWFCQREPRMSPSTDDYRYLTRLNVLYTPLEVVDVPALVAACEHPWYNQTLCRVNDSVVRLGVVQGEYHWHYHDDEDEFFHVVSGQLLIDLEGRTVELSPGQGFVVPKGVRHRTRAPERTVMLMVEAAGIVPTGDA